MDVSRVWADPRFARTVGAGYARAVEHEPLGRALGALIFGADIGRMYRAMDAVAQVPEGAAILDVPCGGGITIARLHFDQPVRYVAMDVSAGMLAHARARLRPDLGTAVRFVEGDIAAIPFGDAEFDLCVCFNGLHCLPDPAAAVAELARVLKPGGRLIGDFVARGQRRRTDAYAALLRAAGTFGPSGTVADARRWLTDAGLHLDEFETSGAITHFVAHR